MDKRAIPLQDLGLLTTGTAALVGEWCVAHFSSYIFSIFGGCVFALGGLLWCRQLRPARGAIGQWGYRLCWGALTVWPVLLGMGYYDWSQKWFEGAWLLSVVSYVLAALAGGWIWRRFLGSSAHSVSNAVAAGFGVALLISPVFLGLGIIQPGISAVLVASYFMVKGTGTAQSLYLPAFVLGQYLIVALALIFIRLPGQRSLETLGGCS